MKRWLASQPIPYRPLGASIPAYVQRVIGHRFDAITSVSTIVRVASPVLLVHGLEDDTVPLADAEAILVAGVPGRVHLLTVPGSHDDYGDIDRNLPALTTFLAKAFSDPPTAT